MNEQFGHRDSERFRDVIRWKNVSGETVPAFGVVQLGQWDDTAGAYDGVKTTDAGTIWVANGPAPVPDDSYGSSAPWVRKQLVMTDGVTTDPVGTIVGPVADQWYMSEDTLSPHFIVMGKRADEDVCSVILKGGGEGPEVGGFAIVLPTGEPVPGIGFTCDAVEATIITASCRSRFQPGDVIYIWDLCRNWLNMPVELLTQTTFSVQYVKIHEPEYDRPESLTGDCRWVVTGMCCVESSVYEY